MPDLSKIYKTLKKSNPNYLKESETDFVNKWTGSEDKLYDQLSNDVEGFSDNVDRKSYDEAAKNNRGKRFFDEQVTAYPTGVKAPAPAVKAPKNKSTNPFEKVGEIRRSFSTGESSTKPLLPGNISPEDFIKSNPKALANREMYDDPNLDEIGKQRGLFSITEQGLNDYIAENKWAYKIRKAQLDYKFPGAIDSFNKEAANIAQAIQNIGEPKTNEEKKLYNSYVKKYQYLVSKNKELVNSFEFKEMQALDKQLSSVPKILEYAKAQTPEYQKHLKWVEDTQNAVDEEKAFEAVYSTPIRFAMRTANRLIMAIGETVNSDIMREYARKGQEGNPNKSSNQYGIYDDYVNLDDEKYVVGEVPVNTDNPEGPKKKMLTHVVNQYGKRIPINPMDIPKGSKVYTEYNVEALMSQLADVGADMIVSSAITGGVGGFGGATSGLARGVLGAKNLTDKIGNLSKITSTLSNTENFIKKGRYLGSILGNGIQAIPEYMQRARDEGLTEDEALFGKIATGLLYGIEGNLNPIELKVADKMFGTIGNTINRAAIKNLSGNLAKGYTFVRGAGSLGKAILGENIEENILEPLINEGVSYANSKLYGYEYESSFPDLKETMQTIAVTTLFSGLMEGFTGDFSKSKLMKNSLDMLMKDPKKSIELLNTLESTNPKAYSTNMGKLKTVLEKANGLELDEKGKSELSSLLYERTFLEQRKSESKDNEVTAYKYEKQLEQVDSNIQDFLDKNTNNNTVTESAPTVTTKPEVASEVTAGGEKPTSKAEDVSKTKNLGSRISKDDTHTTLTVTGEEGEAIFRKKNKGRNWVAVTKDENGNEVETALNKETIDQIIKPRLEEAKQVAKEEEKAAKEEVVRKEQEAVDNYNNGRQKLVESIDKGKVSDEEVSSLVDHIGDLIDEGTDPDEIQAVLDEAMTKDGSAAKARHIAKKLGDKIPGDLLSTIKQMLSDKSKGISGLLGIKEIVDFQKKNKEGRSFMSAKNAKSKQEDISRQTQLNSEIAELGKKKASLEQGRKNHLNVDTPRSKAKVAEFTKEIEALSDQIRAKKKEVSDIKNKQNVSDKLGKTRIPEVTEIDTINSDIAAVDKELSKVRTDKRNTINDSDENYEPGRATTDTDKLSAKERELLDRKKELEARKQELMQDGDSSGAVEDMTTLPAYPEGAKPSSKKSKHSFKKGTVINTPNGVYTYLGKSVDSDGRVFHTFKTNMGFTAKMYEGVHDSGLISLNGMVNKNASKDAKDVLKKSAAGNSVPSVKKTFAQGIRDFYRAYKTKLLAQRLNKMFPGVKISFDVNEMQKLLASEELPQLAERINNIFNRIQNYDSKKEKRSLQELEAEYARLRQKQNDMVEAGIKASQGKLKKLTLLHTTYGFMDPSTGTMYIDLNTANPSTPIHEFGHVWLTYVRASYPELYLQGLKLVQGSDYHKAILSNSAYSALGPEEILDEALATAMEDMGVSLFNKSLGQKIKEWVNKFFNSFKKDLGLRTTKPIQDLTLSEFTNAVAREILSGNGGTTLDYQKAKEHGNKIFSEIFTPANSTVDGEKLKRQSVLDAAENLDNVYQDISSILPEDSNDSLKKLSSQSMFGFEDSGSPFSSQSEISESILNADIPESMKDDYFASLSKFNKAKRDLIQDTADSKKYPLTVSENQNLKYDNQIDLLTDLAVVSKNKPAKIIQDFFKWVKTKTSEFTFLIKDYSKILGISGLIFTTTPIALSEYTGPNDIRNDATAITIGDMVDRDFDSRDKERGLGRIMSIWTKVGKPEVWIDDAFIDSKKGDDFRAWAGVLEQRNKIAPVTVLGNITGTEDLISELANAIQYHTDPDWVNKNFKYDNPKNRDIVEYDRVGSLEYDAHTIIEPILRDYIYGDLTLPELINNFNISERLGVPSKYFDKVVSTNKLMGLVGEHISYKQDAVRVSALKRSAIGDNTDTSNNPADLIDQYLLKRIAEGLLPEYEVFENDQNLAKAGIDTNYIRARFNNLKQRSPQAAYNNLSEILNLPSLKNGDIQEALSKGQAIANRNIEAKGTMVTKDSFKDKLDNDDTGFYQTVLTLHDALSNKGYSVVMHDSFDSYANDIEDAGFDLNNALKNNVLVIGNTVHILNKPEGTDLNKVFSQVDNISFEQAKALSDFVENVYNNIAKRLGKTLEEFKRSIAIRTVPNVSSFIEDIPNSIASLFGMSSQIISDFSNSELDNISVDFQSVYNSVNGKYQKNLGLSDTDYIMSALLDSEDSFSFLGFTQKLSGLGNKDKITKEINDRLLKIRDNAINGSDYFIQELSPEFLRSSLKRARTEVEKENIQQLIDGNQQAISEQIKHLQSIQRSNLLGSLNYLIPSSDYPAEFKYFMIASILKGNQAKDIILYEEDDTTVKGVIPGEKARRNNKTVGNHQELSSMVLPSVYNEVKNGTETHPIKLIDKYTDKSYISREETWEIVKDRVIKETDKGYWVKFEKSSSDSDIQALTLVSKKVAKVMTSNAWCTGGGMASSYLPKGDFYLFLDKELEPQVTVRYDGDQIAELRGTDTGQSLTKNQSEVTDSFLPNLPNGSAYIKQVKASKIYYKLKNEEEFSKEDLQDYFDVYSVELGSYDSDKEEDFRYLKSIFTNNAIALNNKYNLYKDVVKGNAVEKDIQKITKGVLVLGDVYFNNATLPEGFKIESGVTFGGGVDFTGGRGRTVGEFLICSSTDLALD